MPVDPRRVDGVTCDVERFEQTDLETRLALASSYPTFLLARRAWVAF